MTTNILGNWNLAAVSLDAAGLVALADLTTAARRTVLTGTSCLLDALIICPGLHRQQSAVELNGGEYPTCADMITQWVFRVENPATVLFLQKMGKTGCLTTLSVKGLSMTGFGKQNRWRRLARTIYDSEGEAWLATVFYFLAIMLTVVIVGLLVALKDWWAISVVCILALARLINVVVIIRRATPGWHGPDDPGDRDMLILVSQDRWIRLQGKANDVKVVTAGQWLHEPTFLESSATALATLLVYLIAALAGNAKQDGKFLLLVLLFGSVTLLGLANGQREALKLHGMLISKVETSPPFKRRLDMVEMLIKVGESEGRQDLWATRSGMKQPESQATGVSTTEAAPIQDLMRRRTGGVQMV